MARRSIRIYAEALERLRVARGFARQEDLAAAAGVSSTTVSRAENGSKDRVSADTAHKLAKALGVDLEQLGPPPITGAGAVLQPVSTIAGVGTVGLLERVDRARAELNALEVELRAQIAAGEVTDAELRALGEQRARPTNGSAS